MSGRKTGLRVVVTGAATGVGLACAVAFAERGADLILCDRDGGALARAGRRLGAHTCLCDLISEPSIDAFAADIEEEFERIDVLINAAGRAYVRSLGVIRMSRALLPLLHQGRGRRLIVNIASAGGFVSSDCMFPYAGSREGFQRLSEALAEQTRGTSISVATLIPRLARGSVRKSAPAPGQLYWLERIDETATAEDVVSVVARERPDWLDLDKQRERRA